MATETLYATSLVSGTVSGSANALGAPNGVFTTDTGNVSWTGRFAMGNPVGNTPGGVNHTITVVARKEAGQSGNPTFVSISLYAGAALLGTDTKNATISSSVGQNITYIFPISLLSGVALNDIEVEVVTTAAGGSPGARSAVQIDSITWSGDFTTTAPSFSGSVALSGAGTLTVPAGTPTTSGSDALSGDGTLSLSAPGGGGTGEVTQVGGPWNVEVTAAALEWTDITRTGTLQNGDLLVAVIGYNSSENSGNSFSVPAGFTAALAPSANGGAGIAVYQKRVTDAGSEPTTYDFDPAISSRGTVSMVAYRGVDETTPWDAAPVASGSGNNAAGAVFNVTGVTTSTAEAYVISAAAIGASTSGVWTAPTGSTVVANLNGRRTLFVTKEGQASPGATGTFGYIFDLGNLPWRGFVGALKPAPGGGGGGPSGSVALSGSGTVSLSGTAGGAPAQTVVNLWVGGVTDDEVQVAARVTGGGNASLVVSTNSDLSSPITGGPSAISSNLVKVSASGLTAGTTYFYGLSIDGELDVVHTGTFRTAPSGPANFSFVFGSCADTGTDSDAFTRALARDPDLCFITGDFHYEDPSSASAFHTGFDTQLGTTMGDLLSAVPTAYTWSDHDWSSDNNGGASSAMNSTANSIYRSRVPHWALGTGGSTGVYQSFVWGRVRFIVTDERSFKSSGSATDNSSKTMLGTTQKQWFKDQITNATEPVIIWVGDTPWNGAASSPDDEWFAYNTERQELASFFVSSGKNIIRLSGDMHAVAADDGTNSPGGIPILHAAPWYQTFSNKAGPYASGPYPTSGSIVRQYGYVTVTDTGSAITVDFGGYDTSDVERVSWTDTYSTAVDESGTVALSGSGTLSLSGSASASGTVGLSGSGTLALAGTASASGSVALSGSGTLSQAGASTITGAVTLSGAGTLAASGTAAAVGAVGLSGSGTLSSTGAFSITGSVALSGSGTLAGTGTAAVTTPLALSGAGTLALGGTAAFPGAVSLTGDGQLGASGTVEVDGDLPLAGAGSLILTADGSFAGAVDLSGAGSLTSTGSAAVPEALDLAGEGSLGVSGTPSNAGTLNLLGNGVLSYAGEGSEQHNGTVDLSGVGSSTREGAPSVSEDLGLGGDGTLSVSGKASTSGSVPLSGSGNLSSTGGPTATGSVALSGSGTLSASGFGSSGAALHRSGIGSLSVTGSAVAFSGSVDLSGGSEAVFGSIVSGSVALSGAGGLTPAATRITSTGAVDLAGQGGSLWEGEPTFKATVSLSGASSLLLSGAASAVAVLSLSGDGSLAVLDVIVGTDGQIDLSGDGSLDGYPGEVPFYPDLTATILVAPVVHAVISESLTEATIVADTTKVVIVAEMEVSQ